MIIWPSCCHPCLPQSIFTASVLKEKLNHAIPLLKLSNVSPSLLEFLGNTQPHGLPSLPPPPASQFPLLLPTPFSASYPDPLNHHQAHQTYFCLKPPSFGKVFLGKDLSPVTILIAITSCPQYFPPSLACFTFAISLIQPLKHSSNFLSAEFIFCFAPLECKLYETDRFAHHINCCNHHT